MAEDGMTYPNRLEPDVEMKPVVLGPGAYASPDEKTQAGRLVPLSEHPLADDLSEDYGQDALEAGGHAGPGAESGDPDEMTASELDDKYGNDDDYRKSWSKDEKVAYAKKAQGEND